MSLPHSLPLPLDRQSRTGTGTGTAAEAATHWAAAELADEERGRKEREETQGLRPDTPSASLFPVSVSLLETSTLQNTCAKSSQQFPAVHSHSLGAARHPWLPARTRVRCHMAQALGGSWRVVGEDGGRRYV